MTMTGSMTDINPEGSPPATQFFIENFALTLGGTEIISGSLTKAVGQWINFYRNINIQADGGAGSYVYQAFPDAQINLPGWPPEAKGIIFRYYLFRASAPLNGSTNEEIEKLYEQKLTNPKELEIVGTIAPLYPDEEMISAPTGRLLVSNTPNIPTPEGTQNNGGGKIALGPAVIHQKGNTLTADFSGTFPDYYQNGDNPKFDFGPVELVAVCGKQRVPISAVDYANTRAGNARGWLFDFNLTEEIQTLLADDATSLQLYSEKYGIVLNETDYYIASNQQAVYAEQYGSTTEFLNLGTAEPVTVSVYRRGNKVTAADGLTMKVWQYRSIPLQAPGDAVLISSDFKPGETLEVDTDTSDNRLITFTVNGADNPDNFPPQSYLDFMNPPYVTNAPQISIRILPNDEDFSAYYVDPNIEEPVGNESLTFDVVYEKVLRTYYLLYPSMNGVFELNDPAAVKSHAKKILERTEMAIWLSTKYMPRTRDLSESRRKLLRAWCLKVLAVE
ncbi:MAG: hypothetical protein ACR2PT_04495 [Endozoicomonas sp.]